MNQELRIGRRTFTVETVSNPDGPPKYHLLGVRGARYFTIRNAHRPELMFLGDMRKFGCATGFEGVWLTDKNGTLEVAE